MSNYKFKVGDKVRILKMDEWSNEDMVDNIGRIGIIASCSNEEGVNGYLIDGFWYMENSLELTESKKDCNEELISKNDVLNILYGAISDETICGLIRRVRELPCK